MNSILICSASTAFTVALTTSALGQVSLSYDDSGTPAPGTYEQIQNYSTTGAEFLNNTGSGTNPWSVGPIGTNRTTITTAGGPVTLYDICAEMFVGPTGTSDYSVTSGLGTKPWDTSAARILISNAVGDGFDTARVDFENGGTTTYDDVAVFGAALQMAVWDLIEDDGDMFAGDLIFAGDLGLSLPSPNSLTSDAAAVAQGWLDNLSNGTWNTEVGGLEFYYAEATEAGNPGTVNQDRIMFGVNAIPEPSSFVLGLLGTVGILLRRRR